MYFTETTTYYYPSGESKQIERNPPMEKVPNPFEMYDLLPGNKAKTSKIRTPSEVYDLLYGRNKSQDTKFQYSVIEEGAPVVNGATALGDPESGVLAFEIDLHSKYCEVVSTGTSKNGPTIHFRASEDSLYLNESCPRDAWTGIAFLGCPGWSVWAIHVERYTCYVCLVKDEK